MADTVQKRWSTEDFLIWESKQDTRHEFVRGVVRAMVGATRVHSRIGRNVLTTLHMRLKAGRCEPYGSDMKIVAPNGNVRFADVVVDCGVGRPSDLAAEAPTVAVEVLSKSTKFLDQTEKLDEYQSIPSMWHILHLSQERPEGELWTRTEHGWIRTPLRGLDAVAALDAVGVSLPFAVAYDGVEFDLEPPPQNDNR